MRAILTYHSIDDSGSVLSIGREAFRQHLGFLERRGVRVVSIEQLLRLPGDGDAVALTFDDGFVNFETEAWPLLRQRGHAVTLFVTSDHTGGTNAWERGNPRVPEQPLLGWPALRRLAAEGVTLGAHGASHARLPGLPPEALQRELDQPADRIADETGSEPNALAYPYGEHDDEVVAAARRRYALACTTQFRVLQPGEDPHRLPRLDMWYFRNPHRLEGWGTRSFRRYLQLRDGLRRARRIISGGVKF